MANELPSEIGDQRIWLIQRLLDERPEAHRGALPPDEERQRALLRALMNTRPAGLPPADFLAVQDSYLAKRLSQRGLTRLADLSPIGNPHSAGVASRTYLWQGDITTLEVDAIVNAANSAMEGCFIPGHHCIDNAIHTFAGVQLRYECSQMMAAQGHPEPTGRAKATSAYNLPARQVLHTVGPIAQGSPTPEHEQQLASCYTSCLLLAEELGLESVAFCCISTGVFGFPAQHAAEIAIETVVGLLEGRPHMNVVFNVFGDDSRIIYEGLLAGLVAQ